MKILGGFTSRGRGKGMREMGFQTTEKKPWGTTQRTPKPNFMEIEHFLGMRKSGRKSSGESEDGGNNTSQTRFTPFLKSHKKNVIFRFLRCGFFLR